MDKHVKTFVYCIQERSREAYAPIKIGIAQDPQARMLNLQVGNPMRLAVYGLIGPFTSVEAGMVESDLHVAMSKHRIRGEWFTGNAVHLFDEVQTKHGVHLDQVTLVA